MPKALFAWWYLSIAVGFALLAARVAIAGGPWWGVALRLVIAAGFGALAVFEFRNRSAR